MGVRTAKYTIAIIIGAITNPNISPNLIQNLLSGASIFDFNNPRTKKIKDIDIKYTFIFCPFDKGHKLRIKKTIKNNKPKLLLELFDFI